MTPPPFPYLQETREKPEDKKLIKLTYKSAGVSVPPSSFFPHRPRPDAVIHTKDRKRSNRNRIAPFKSDRAREGRMAGQKEANVDCVDSRTNLLRHPQSRERTCIPIRPAKR